MAKSRIPTADELREYLDQEKAYLNDCLANHKTFVITGPKFPGESIWQAACTLPLLEAAEAVGTSNAEIWALCSKISSMTHAPVTKKEYERMRPFAQKPPIVNAVLQYLGTYRPNFEDWSLNLSGRGYYYCLALISQSDYRHEECEKQLWNTVTYHIQNDPKVGTILLRNFKMLEDDYPYLTPMKEALLKAQNSKQ